jgi:eukaryotic-like serine/threonine-protein kinase
MTSADRASQAISSLVANDLNLPTLPSASGDQRAYYRAPDSSNDPTEALPDSDSCSSDYSLPAIGELIDGTYRITEEISRGAMGVVLGAFDEHLQRHVATKWIRGELLRPGFVRRFLQEAQAMARVAHPHVVRIHAYGQHQHVPYFVMERIDGHTLEEWLNRRFREDPSRDEAPRSSPHLKGTEFQTEVNLRLRLLDEICAGVAAIHAAGTVHRDLKPSNILLDTELRCHVADFGVSTLGHAPDSTQVGGTLVYMAPELVLSFGEQQPGHAVSDVYSLGCIASELLNFGDPVPAHRRRISSLRQKDARVEPVSLHPALPSALTRVIQDALHPDPALRTQSVEAFQSALQRARAGVPDRILIAEDDDDFRELLREALQTKFPSAEIACAADGKAALASVELHPAAIALVDLQMPTIDGAMLTQALRSRPETANMPIIVLSGSGGAAEWQRLSSFGADRFLVKPVHLDDVVSIIEHAMRERTEQQAATLR